MPGSLPLDLAAGRFEGQVGIRDRAEVVTQAGIAPIVAVDEHLDIPARAVDAVIGGGVLEEEVRDGGHQLRTRAAGTGLSHAVQVIRWDLVGRRQHAQPAARVQRHSLIECCLGAELFRLGLCHRRIRGCGEGDGRSCRAESSEHRSRLAAYGTAWGGYGEISSQSTAIHAVPWGRTPGRLAVGLVCR